MAYLATQAPRRTWCSLVILLPLLFPALAPAGDPAAGASFQEQVALAEASPRLAPLGLEKLMEIEVSTVTRRESTVGESAAAVCVIRQEDIRRSGVTTIPELLRRVPGLNVARIDNSRWAISARGFNDQFSNKLLVQIDGRSVYNPMFSGVYWDAVDYPLEDIERIEVVRGPGASVWGANAVNGVINIITKSAKDTEGGLVTAGGGTKERKFGTFRYGAAGGKDLSYRLFAKGFDRDEQFSPQGNPNDQWWGASGGSRVDWQPSRQDAFTFDAGYLHSTASRIAQRATPTPPGFVDTLSDAEITDTGHFLTRWSHLHQDGSNWTVLAYWDYFRRNAATIGLDMIWRTYDIDFQHQFYLGDRQNLIWGVEYQVQEVFLGNTDNSNGLGITWDRNHRHPQLFSAFVQDQISLVKDRLSLTLGSKFEHNDYTGFEAQPTARILWTVTPHQSVWGAVSRAVRTPALNEVALRGTFVPARVSGLVVFPASVPNGNFRSEEVVTYETGYRAQATERISLDTALFYNSYHHLSSLGPANIVPGPAPGTILASFLRLNEGNGETYGGEVAADWKPTDAWQLYGSYTLLKMYLHPASGQNQNPQQQVYLQSSLDFPNDVELDVSARWVDQISGFNSTGVTGMADAIPSYFSLDLRLGWHPSRNWELSLVGTNLTSSRHPEFGTSPAFRGRDIEIERTMYGKVTWRF